DPTGKNNVLNATADEELLTWDLSEIGEDSVPNVEEAGELRIMDLRRRAGGNPVAQTGLPTRISAHQRSSDTPPQATTARQSLRAHPDSPVRRPGQEAVRPGTRFTASSVGCQDIDAEVSVIATLGEPLVDKGGKDWNLSG